LYTNLVFILRIVFWIIRNFTSWFFYVFFIRGNSSLVTRSRALKISPLFFLTDFFSISFVNIKLLDLELHDFFLFPLCGVILILYPMWQNSSLNWLIFQFCLSSYSLFESWSLLFYSIISMPTYPGLLIRREFNIPTRVIFFLKKN
jgi:hypothetical protein